MVTRLDWIEELAHAPTVLDQLALTLRRCRHHDDFDQWVRIKAESEDPIDAIRDVICEGADEQVSIDGETETVVELVEAATTRVAAYPLAVMAAVARGLDDRYDRLLVGPWVDTACSGGPLADGDLIVMPDPRHLRSLYGPETALAASQTRTFDRPDQTRLCRLFEGSLTTPPIRFSSELAPHLDEILTDAEAFATAHPTARSSEYNMALPMRPLDADSHTDRCVDLLERAFAARASVVIFPEYSGVPGTTDALRTSSPQEPALVVAGSGHISATGSLVNRSLVWIARPSGNIPAIRPLAVDKMVPYDGDLGQEPLTSFGTEIVIQVDGSWRLAVGICRDLLRPAMVDALSQVGANLVAVPAWSPKTTNLVSAAGAVAAATPGFAMVANGPRMFVNPETGREVEVPLGMFGSPVDRVPDPVPISEGTPPCLCLYHVADHVVSTI